MKLKCLIVEDEPIARKGIEEYVNDIPFLELVGSCESALPAGTILSENKIDLMLLDIRLPRTSALTSLNQLIIHLWLFLLQPILNMRLKVIRWMSLTIY
jgi:YesN/AraC family two-component response regulator